MISVEVTSNSGVCIVNMIEKMNEQILVPFAFRGDRVELPPRDQHYYLWEVPLEGSGVEGNIPVSPKYEIPASEAVRRGLIGYIVKSEPVHLGGSINGVTIEPGMPPEGEGILFIST